MRKCYSTIIPITTTSAPKSGSSCSCCETGALWNSWETEAIEGWHNVFVPSHTGSAEGLIGRAMIFRWRWRNWELACNAKCFAIYAGNGNASSGKAAKSTARRLWNRQAVLFGYWEDSGGAGLRSGISLRWLYGFIGRWPGFGSICPGAGRCSPARP